VNLALATQPADLLRAVLEGVAFSLRAAADVVRTIAPIEACLTTGGGARSRLWLQIFADVLGMKLLRPPAEEGAAYGAALLAGVGAGCFTNLEAAFALLPASGEIIQPQTVQSQAEYEDGFDRFKRLYAALKAV
jgi:xylulokinase